MMMIRSPSPFLLRLALFATTVVPLLVVEAATCGPYQAEHTFEASPRVSVPPTLQYGVQEDKDSGDLIFSARVIYEGLGYVSWGLSMDGGMDNAYAVVGLPDKEKVSVYFMGGYSPLSFTNLNDQNLLLTDDSSQYKVEQNETHTILEFATKSLVTSSKTQGLTVVADGTTTNHFLIAVGFDNTFGYHSYRSSVALPVQVSSCSSEEEEEEEEEEDTAEVEAAAVVEEAPPTSCNQYQAQHSFFFPLTIQYGVQLSEQTGQPVFSAKLIYEGLGYVSWGLSSNGAMTNAYAVVGQPSEDDASGGSVDTHWMNGYSLASFTNLNDQNLLLTDDAEYNTTNVQQNATHTVLEFSTTSLVTTDASSNNGLKVVADGTTTNYFLVAVGTSNQLGFHKYRSSVGLPVKVCIPSKETEEGTATIAEAEIVEVKLDNKISLFQWHGWLAGLAWAIVAPLAVTSSLCRHLLPSKPVGLWFKIHFYGNVLVVVLTLLSFGLAVKAIQDTEGGNHFTPNTPANAGSSGQHRVVGLVVILLVLIQAMAGVARPGGGEPNRKLWEFTHKGSGFALVGMSYYQCHSGLVLYGKRFVAEELMDQYIAAFWIIAGIITGIGCFGYIHKTLNADAPAAPATNQEEEEESSSVAKFKNDMTQDPTQFGSSDDMGRRNSTGDGSKHQTTTGRSSSSDGSIDVEV